MYMYACRIFSIDIQKYVSYIGPYHMIAFILNIIILYTLIE